MRRTWLRVLPTACWLAACAPPGKQAADAPAPPPPISAGAETIPHFIEGLTSHAWRQRNVAARALARSIERNGDDGFSERALRRLVDLTEPNLYFNARTDSSIVIWPPPSAPWQHIRNTAAVELTGSDARNQPGQSAPDLVLGPDDLIAPWPTRDLAKWILRCLPAAVARSALDHVDGPDASLWLHAHGQDAASRLASFADDPKFIMGAVRSLSGAELPAFYTLELPPQPEFDEARHTRIMLFDRQHLPPILQRDAVRLSFEAAENLGHDAVRRIVDGLSTRDVASAALDAAFAIAGDDPRSQRKLAAFACRLAPVPPRHLPRLLRCFRGEPFVRNCALLALHDSELRAAGADLRREIAEAAFRQFQLATEPDIRRLALVVFERCNTTLSGSQAEALISSLEASDRDTLAAHALGILHRSSRLPPLDASTLQSLAVRPHPTASAMLAASRDGVDEAWLRTSLEELFAWGTAPRERRELAKALGKRHPDMLRRWLGASQAPAAQRWIALEGLGANGMLTIANLEAQLPDPHAIDLLIGSGAPSTIVNRALRTQTQLADRWIDYVATQRLPADTLVDVLQTELRQGRRLDLLDAYPPTIARAILLRFFHEDPQPYRTRLLTALCRLELDVPFDPQVEHALLALWRAHDRPGVPEVLRNAWRLPESVVDSVLAEASRQPGDRWPRSTRTLVLRHRGDPARR